MTDIEKTRIVRNRTTLQYKKSNAQKVVETRWRNKMRLVEYKGGKCEKCGYSKPIAFVFHFHHLDPSTKSFNIGYNLSLSIKTLMKEVDKCQLLCANCHGEIHDKENHEKRKHTINEWLDWDLEKESIRKRKNPSTNICKQCNTPFNSKKKNQKFCCKNCYFLYKKI